MKQPFVRGSAIDLDRLDRLSLSFLHYRDTVSNFHIQAWLKQFKPADQDLAARILDSVDFITPQQIRTAFNSLLKGLPGWNIDNKKRRGKWRFVAFGSSAGESGDTMLHVFRQANGLSGKYFNELFIHKSDLLKAKMGPDDTVVFVDDFSGSGKQACDTWAEDIQELLPESPKIYLLLVVCNIHARKRVQTETRLDIYSHIELTDNDNIFSAKCKFFTTRERQVLIGYCRKADRKNPMGYGDCGLLLVFHHNCPNDSIPILHVNHPNWVGLFRRHN